MPGRKYPGLRLLTLLLPAVPQPPLPTLLKEGIRLYSTVTKDNSLTRSDTVRVVVQFRVLIDFPVLIFQNPDAGVSTGTILPMARLVSN